MNKAPVGEPVGGSLHFRFSFSKLNRRRLELVCENSQTNFRVLAAEPLNRGYSGQLKATKLGKRPRSLFYFALFFCFNLLKS